MPNRGLKPAPTAPQGRHPAGPAQEQQHARGVHVRTHTGNLGVPLDRDPRTAELAETYLIPLNIGAMLDTLIVRSGRTVGVLCHEHMGTPRHWTPVEVARDGEEALRRVAAWAAGEPSTLVILLDLKLPKIDGLDVLRQIKEQPTLRGIPVVVLTSSEEGRDIRAAYLLGANSYLVKPANFDKLMRLATHIET
ncbi:response regulator [Methylomagnum sp.]